MRDMIEYVTSIALVVMGVVLAIMTTILDLRAIKRLKDRQDKKVSRRAYFD